jgi:hypothetical protein
MKFTPKVGMKSHTNKKNKEMKTIVLALIAILVFPSCIRFVPQGQGGVRPMGQQNQAFGSQGGQMGPRRLDSVDVKKIDIGRIGIRTKNASPAQRSAVKVYVIDYYTKHRQIPTNEALSQKFGFPVQTTGSEDTPDRVVGRVRVRPDEVPANIRARFQ